MAQIQRAWCTVTILLTTVLFSGLHAARLKRQTSDKADTSFLQDLQKLARQSPAQTLTNNGVDVHSIMESVKQTLGPNAQALAGQGQTVDLSRLMQLTNSVQQNGEDRVEFTLNNADPNNPDSPVVSVVVETLSAGDLLASERGRQQLSQLNAQLEQAVNSVGQGVQMMQGQNREENMIQGDQNGVETMFAGIVNMLTSGDNGHVLVGVMDTPSMQAVKQLAQTLDQLPGLKVFLQRFYRFVEHLHTVSPSTAKDIQQLITNAVMSFQGMNGGLGQDGAMMGTESMLEMALKGLNDNLQLFEVMVNEMPEIVQNPTFLLVVNDTHCIMRSLTGDLSTDIATGCLQHLMQVIAMVNQSEHMITEFLHSLTHFMNSPHTLQSFADFMKMPSLDKAFALLHLITGDVNDANSNIVTAIQALQSMLRSLLKNKPLLETLANIVQNPESSQVYQNVMQVLKDTTLGNPTTEQLLSVVNDSISRLIQDGNFQMAVEKIQEILTALKNNQDPTQPLSEAQQALFDLINQLLEAAQNAADSETTTIQNPTSTIPTTVKPVDTSTTKFSATTLSITTSTKNSQTAQPTTAGPGRRTTTDDGTEPSLPPRTTPRSETKDDNASDRASLSAFTLLMTLMASMFWV